MRVGFGLFAVLVAAACGGGSSGTELEELVINKGLNFGMDLSKYKLDKD